MDAKNKTSKPPLWLKCKSTKRPDLCYYYNMETRESVWEEPQGVKIQEFPTTNPAHGVSNACSHSKEDFDEELLKKLIRPEPNLKLKEKILHCNKEVNEKFKTKQPVGQDHVSDLFDEELLKKVNRSGPNCNSMLNVEFKQSNAEIMTKPQNKQTEEKCLSDKFNYNFNSSGESDKFTEQFSDDSCDENVSEINHFHVKKEVIKPTKWRIGSKRPYNAVGFKVDPEEKSDTLLSDYESKPSTTCEIPKIHSNSRWPEDTDFKEPVDMEVLQKRVKIDYSHNQPLPRVSQKVYKTPIQDRFNKQKEELLNKQKMKKENEDKSKSFQLDNKKQQNTSTNSQEINKRNGVGKTLNQSCQNGVSTEVLKRKSSPDNDFTKRPKLEFEGLPNPICQNVLSNGTTFDLRIKLQQRKTLPSLHKPSCVTSKDSSSEMEWEDLIQSQQPQNKVSCTNNDFLNITRGQEQQSLTCAAAAAVKLPDYKRIYLVCDTSSLVDNCEFVESLIAKGSYIGLAVTVVIPFIVFSELDKLKNLKETVGYAARKISRTINDSHQKNSHQKNSLHLQDGNKSREPVGSLELSANDDLILNCCLQTREACKEGELAILMTGDNNLSNKASSFKLDTHKWTTFQRWARGYKEQKRCMLLTNGNKTIGLQTNCPRLPNTDSNVDVNENMDVDASSSSAILENKSPSTLIEPYNFKEKSLLGSEAFTTNSPLTAQRQNCIQSHLDELKLEFRVFLHNVLDEAVSEEYGALKSFGNNITPGWTLFNYILEIKNRWFMITSSYISVNVQRILSQLVTVLKKCNSGKEELTVADVETIFSLCSKLANMFAKKYQKHTTQFLEKLSNLQEEWKEAYFSISLNNSSQNICDDDVLQPVDLALQNIYTCLNSDYEFFKREIEQSKDDTDLKIRLTLFHKNTKNLSSALKGVFQENRRHLACRSESIIHLNKLLTCFSNGRGTKFGFEITLENVVEYFQDLSFRKNVKQHLDNFEKLDIQVDKLIRGTEDY